MATNRDRTLYSRIDKLDADERLLEQKESVLMAGGSVDCSTGSTQRQCRFDLQEKLPDDWQGNRWKLWYGYKGRDDTEIIYIPLGVFIPVNPRDRVQAGAWVSNYQGTDKSKLFFDYKIPSPVDWPSGTTIYAIVTYCCGVVGETRPNIAPDLGTIAAPFTFEENTSLGTILGTLLSGRNAEWFYDREGVMIVRNIQNISGKDPVLTLDPADPIEFESEREVDDTTYFNAVTVVGGKSDTDIYRSSIQDDAAIVRAGGRIVREYFKLEGAVEQTHVDAVAAAYLKEGVLLPFTISQKNLVIPDLEVGDIIQRTDRRFKVKWFNVPLGIDTQTIKGGEVLL